MNKKSKEILEDVVRRADAMIEKLSVWVDEAKDIKATSLAQLAESDEKPKLRHGDYCQSPSKEYTYIALNSRTDPEEFEIWGKNDFGIHQNIYQNGTVKKDTTYYTPTGQSIFDDLAALKPIEEFEMECDLTGFNHIEITKCDNGLFLRTKGGTVHLHGKKLHDFILKLRCMELRKIQDAAKQ